MSWLSLRKKHRKKDDRVLFTRIGFKKQRKMSGIPTFHQASQLGISVAQRSKESRKYFASFLSTLPETNIAMENPPFWWYLPGKMGIFMGYVSLREGNQPNSQPNQQLFLENSIINHSNFLSNDYPPGNEKTWDPPNGKFQPENHQLQTCLFFAGDMLVPRWYSWKNQIQPTNNQWDFQGPPIMGPPYGKRDPYIPISLGILMGVGLGISMDKGSLKIPLKRAPCFVATSRSSWAVVKGPSTQRLCLKNPRL